MDEEMVGNGGTQGGIGNVGVEEEGLDDVGRWRDGAVVGGEGGCWDGGMEEDEGNLEIGRCRRG